MVKETIEKIKKRLVCPNTNFSGTSGVYVVLILGLIGGLSFLLTGGLAPNIEREPENPQFVEIEDPITPVVQANLQMQNIGLKPTNTPTPTVSPTSTQTNQTPTPTLPQTIEQCLNNTAIDVLLDLSNSMNTTSKISALRNALGSFSDQLQNDTVIGVQGFAGPASMGSSGTEIILPFTRVGSNRTGIRNELISVTPSQTSPDGTYMRNGFNLALSQINAAKQQFPDYRFVTVVFSDGVPETQFASQSPCTFEYNSPGNPNYLCFAQTQDPRESPSLSNSMKNAVDEVYSVAIYNHSPSSRDGQAQVELRDLLQDIASGRNTPYYQDANTTNPGELTQFFNQIIAGICQ